MRALTLTLTRGSSGMQYGQQQQGGYTQQARGYGQQQGGYGEPSRALPVALPVLLPVGLRPCPEEADGS